MKDSTKSRMKLTLRYLEHLARVSDFNRREEVLDPNRIVNRILYGTDYDPNDVKLNLYSELLTMKVQL